MDATTQPSMQPFSNAEEFRKYLEGANEAADTYRSALEAARKNGAISLEDYRTKLGKYQTAVSDYKSGIQNYQEILGK